MGLLELYEYLKSAPFVGPFGTVENPVLVPSIHTERVVGCTGGSGDNEHVPLWFRCREGFLYRCGECDQIFMHVRIGYGASSSAQESKPAVDPDVDELFDMQLVERGYKLWNTGEYVNWPSGKRVYEDGFVKGLWNNVAPEVLPLVPTAEDPAPRRVDYT
eukprot:GHVT01043442.1.p1 GENE.GHVT01043442.1~~GHVT01043442.1.p1  ORF type:complete len:160 (-),score=30.06 GHVT01043442.1:910-1389(-)